MRVTYTPLENGDPITTNFGGFAFRSGEPVDIPEDAMINQTIVKETGKSAEGEPRNKGVERQVPVLDVLKSNPYFRVEGAPPPPAKGKPGRPRIPKTPEEYKGYAMESFARAESHTALAEKWDAEKDLREKLGVHDDGDIVSYLRPFFDAKFHDLRKAAS